METKRLLKDRMYILPNGVEFWYFAKWDRFNAIGKIRHGGVLVNDTIRLMNLRKCPIVPKGKESWIPA